MGVASHHVTVNGLNMHYVSMGEGPPVLLLHGFPDTHSIWRKQIPALAAAGMRVIAPDMRGYGQTDAPSSTGASKLPETTVPAPTTAMLPVTGQTWRVPRRRSCHRRAR